MPRPGNQSRSHSQGHQGQGAAAALAPEAPEVQPAPQPDAPAQPEGTPPVVSKPATAVLSFSTVDFTEVPEFAGPSGKGRKYAALETALKALPEGKAITFPIPTEAGNVDKFVSNLLSAVRHTIPNTRSRTANGVMYLWVGAPSTRKKGGK